jgi:phosphatidylglycerophosphatase C
LTFTDAGPDDKRFGAAPRKKNASENRPNSPAPASVLTHMGSADIGRQGAPATEIVAFDFDGTLSFRDSFLAFLTWRRGPLRYTLGLLRLLPASLAYLIDRDRGRLKAKATWVFLRGLHREELERACLDFSRSPLGRRLIRPDAEQCWREWRARGAFLVIVTASPEEVVAPFARALGADLLIGTRLEFDREDRLTGAFASENCRGPEKVRRLQAVFGSHVRLEAAYGDTSGDHQMLELARIKGYRVFHGQAGAADRAQQA